MSPRPARSNVSAPTSMHPGRVPRLVLVGVRDEDAVRRFAEAEGEGVERPGRSHPGEAVGPQIDRGWKWSRYVSRTIGVDAVGGDDQVGRRQLRRCEEISVWKRKFHAQRAGALVQQHQQRAPRAAAEPVAADAVHGALEADLDVVPVGEVVGDRAVALPVVLLERIQRRVGEHDAEAERVVGAIALVDGDVGGRLGLLHQDREIEPRRAAAEHADAHRCLLASPPPGQAGILHLKDRWDNAAMHGGERSMDPQGRHALITGGGSGIGAAVARAADRGRRAGDGAGSQ